MHTGQTRVLAQQQELQAAAQERQMLEARAPLVAQQRQASAGEALELQRLQACLPIAFDTVSACDWQ